jgi:hypothetical protein
MRLVAGTLSDSTEQVILHGNVFMAFSLYMGTLFLFFIFFGWETLLPTEPNTPTEGNPILKIYTVLLVHTTRKSLSTQ